jgi:SAM-dependent methyltransferase
VINLILRREPTGSGYEVGVMTRLDFKPLFAALQAADYFWQTVTPERLQSLRKSPPEGSGEHGALVRFFGIGETPREKAALEAEVFEELRFWGMTEEDAALAVRLKPAISRVGDLFVAHSHWPARAGEPYVHLGPESLELAELLPQRTLRGARVLDLGSGSGVHSLLGALGGAERTLGLEISSRAVEWATASARAQGLAQCEFSQVSIGSREADEDAAPRGERGWNLAISNPPLAVPSPGEKRPHRDGGRLGVELPLLFLDFAARHLEPGGEAFFTVTNPIVLGKSVFFEAFDRKLWAIIEKKRLSDRFNASLHRKEGYKELGIEHIELWFLHLKLLAKSSGLS